MNDVGLDTIIEELSKNQNFINILFFLEILFLIGSVLRGKGIS
jgi:hypothetical protein